MRRVFCTVGLGLLLACCGTSETASTPTEPAAIQTGFVLDGVRHPVEGAAIVTMSDPGGFDAIAAYADNRDDPDFTQSYAARHLDDGAVAPVAALSEVVWRVVLRADFTPDAAAGFRADVGRSLSSHFYVDFDGVVYQALDLALAAHRATDLAYSDAAAAHNDHELVITLNNALPDLARDPGAAPFQAAHKRAVAMAQHPRPMAGPTTINGRSVTTYGYTDVQYAALDALLRELRAVFPKLAVGPPRDAAGAVPSSMLADWPARQGVLAQWHTSRTSWLPGPGLDWQRLRF